MTTDAATMDNFSLGEAGGIFAGIVALLASIGGGIRWLLGWNDRRDRMREQKLQAWEASLTRREIESRERTEARLRALEEKLSATTSLMLEMAGELQRLDPSSPVLAKVRHVLVEAFPVPHETPPELKALVRRLDEP